MSTDRRERLAQIRRFDQLVAYLRDELDWPIGSDDFEELTFEYTPEELGIDVQNAAKIQEIKRLRPLVTGQPWGIFFVKFERKRLPVVALRRILGQVAIKKRASANQSERRAWGADDLLFVSNYGEGEERRIAFAHFSRPQEGHDLPTLKVLGWDNLDTPLHLDAVASELTENLAWPDDEHDSGAWRERWRSAFALRHREVITTSKQLSKRLAELARAIRDRIRTALAIETESGPLTKLMKAFQTALVDDLDKAGFADMYAQTIAYGLLSARITNPARRTADDLAAHMRTNPFLKELMEIFLHVGGRRSNGGGLSIDFDELGVSEVVELLDQANMEAVVRDFGDRNPREDPVIHFYEHFLASYDKKQKVSRGVFYTPRPVVSYIVRSVDELLRKEFGLTDGLADTTTWDEMTKRHKYLRIPEGTSPDQAFVQILDPATGTGTFLVEVIDLIHKTMVEGWKAKGHAGKEIEDLWNDYVPTDLLPRLHGYELLMAPYAIAHLKIGLKLYETGYRFENDERARVYLTNALEPSGDGQFTLDFLPALAHEAKAVNEIKKGQRFTVVIGNPPYSVSSWNSGAWIVELTEDYKRKVRSEESQIQSLSNDYIKFIRLSQSCIDSSNIGLLGLITGHGYLYGTQPRDLRLSLSHSFSRLFLLDLHGSVRRSHDETTVDEPVFEIMTGVAICLAIRSRTVTSRLLGQSSQRSLTGALVDKFGTLANSTVLRLHNGVAGHFPAPPFYHFAPASTTREIAEEYQVFVDLPSCFGTGNRIADKEKYWATGMASQQDELAISFSADETDVKLRDLAESKSYDDLGDRYRICTTSQWSYEDARVWARTNKWRNYLGRVAYRPFDLRWSVLHKHILTILRRKVMSQLSSGSNNVALVVSRAVNDTSFAHTFVVDIPVDKIFLSSKTSTNAYVFPLFFDHDQLGTRTRQPNLSREFLKAFCDVTGTRLDTGSGLPKGVTAHNIFHYMYAVLHSPAYRLRYEEPLKVEFPRLPIPSSVELFSVLADLGEVLAELHLFETSKLSCLISTYTGPKNPEVGRVGWLDGTVWLDAGKTNARVGHRATKPGTIGFKGVPEQVWNFLIGGYQVCHKWLKDRKGRILSDEDIAHYQKIVVALNETIRIMEEIDKVIEAHGGWPNAFQTKSAIGEVPRGTAKVVSFRPPTVEPTPKDRYVTCVPLVPLRAAAGTFSDPQHIEDNDFEWVEVTSRHRLRKGMFVAQVVGNSMEPAVRDGSWCLFRSPVEGTRQGMTVLVQLRDTTDPETGQRYTVKRYKSEKEYEGDSWSHVKITLEPVNPDFQPIVLTGADEDELQIIAELVEVLWN